MRHPRGRAGAGQEFRQVTVSDAVVGYLSSPTCANFETRRHHFAVLGLLADELGILRPLARVNAQAVAAAAERLWGSVEPAVQLDRQAVVDRWLRWCRSVADWEAPQPVAVWALDAPDAISALAIVPDLSTWHDDDGLSEHRAL